MRQKRLLPASVLFLLFPFLVNSQNFQLHYDLDKERGFFTSTLEMFKPDTFGSTFFFVDMDYDMEGNKTASLSYFEIARYITLPIWNRKLDATIQFNDGFAVWGPLGQAWLAGFSYPIKLGNFVVKTDLLYRSAQGSKSPDAQLTVAWYHLLWKERLCFTGFFDVWSQGTKGNKEMVVLGEPQLWLRTWQNLSLGTELELSYNFLPGDEIQLFPTLGLKWDF